MTPRVAATRPHLAGRPATIRDVAARAGVATSTVSRILAGEPQPRPGNAEAVRRAVRELAYRPDLVARSMRTGTTAAIGVIIDNLLDPVLPPMVRAMSEAAEAAGYAVVLGTAVDGPAHAALEVSRLLGRRVDGLIIACSWPADSLGARAASFLVPVVLANTEGPAVGLPQFGTDNLAGGRLVADHLAGLGHRRIAWIGGPSTAPFDGVRLRGLREAWVAAGLDPVDVVVLEGDGTMAGGQRAADALRAVRPPVTAVACYNDLSAIGLARAVTMAGLRIPEDLSVAGFDDIAAAAWVHPGLTTVRQETEAMGRLAVERLVGLMTGDGARHVPDTPVRLPMTLRVRESTGRPTGRGPRAGGGEAVADPLRHGRTET
jgi:DNA-binding LacI/PurR family transcriptional regulator